MCIRDRLNTVPEESIPASLIAFSKARMKRRQARGLGGLPFHSQTLLISHSGSSPCPSLSALSSYKILYGKYKWNIKCGISTEHKAYIHCEISKTIIDTVGGVIIITLGCRKVDEFKYVATTKRLEL